MAGKKGWHHTAEAKARIAAAKRGERNPRWRHVDVSFKAAHTWLRRNCPKSGKCERCGAPSFDYAFRHHPAPYTRNRDDYEELCRACHMHGDGRVMQQRGPGGRFAKAAL